MENNKPNIEGSNIVFKDPVTLKNLLSLALKIGGSLSDVDNRWLIKCPNGKNLKVITPKE